MGLAFGMTACNDSGSGARATQTQPAPPAPLTPPTKEKEYKVLSVEEYFAERYTRVDLICTFTLRDHDTDKGAPAHTSQTRIPVFPIVDHEDVYWGESPEGQTHFHVTLRAEAKLQNSTTNAGKIIAQFALAELSGDMDYEIKGLPGGARAWGSGKINGGGAVHALGNPPVDQSLIDFQSDGISLIQASCRYDAEPKSL